ncbi:hypothetical protein, partial [Sansalvadorimonas verongulae]|uniref:hypothetical protein n=1 Tax=Sansalvadorimonas verongulae TaxID=2172824 RepID=UPI001E428097
SKAGSAGYDIVKVGGVQSYPHSLSTKGLGCRGYQAYSWLDSFACKKEEAPVDHGALSHSVAVCSYSE